MNRYVLLIHGQNNEDTWEIDEESNDLTSMVTSLRWQEDRGFRTKLVDTHEEAMG